MAQQDSKERETLSMFVFGGSKADKAKVGNVSTSPKNNQLTSPLQSPVTYMESLQEHPESSIFERSVQDSNGFENSCVPKCNRCSANRSRSCTHNSMMSLQSGKLIKNEDCIPAALDATTSILNDKGTNLDDIEMIYPNRRNSSVLGLNMALGRSSLVPSRKNSLYSCQSFPHPTTCPDTCSQSTISQQLLSPVSPPKLQNTRSLSFYSYADMLNNDEYARRPSFQLSYSQGIVPTKGSMKSFHQSFTKAPLARTKSQNSSSQLSKQFSSNQNDKNKTNMNKFLISPESSDGEENDFVSVKSGRKSIVSNSSFYDNESLVSSLVGDCIRQNTTEIYGI